MDYLSTSLVVGGYLLTLLLVPWALFQTRKQPVSMLAWITAIVTLPYAGGILFLLFGTSGAAAVAPGRARQHDEVLLWKLG
jgi:hypothetical protein